MANTPQKTKAKQFYMSVDILYIYAVDIFFGGYIIYSPYSPFTKKTWVFANFKRGATVDGSEIRLTSSGW